MQQPLFDEIQRTDGSPGLRTEDSFSFLNRARGVVWERIRNQLDGWYAAFPDVDGDVRRRYRSRDLRQHYASWWELYLHAVFSALGYKLTVHPEIAGHNGHPDFLAERGQESFYIEAVTVFSGIVDQSRRSRLEAAVLDAIDTVDASLFMVRIGFERVGQSMPTTRSIVDPIEAWLATLDVDDMLAKYPGGYSPAKERIAFGDWVIELKPIAREAKYRGCPDNRLIGIGPISAGYTNDVQQIRRAVTRKKKQLGTPDKPLVVAALAPSGTVDNWVIENVLFGSEAVQLGPGDTTSLTRSPDGIWIGKRGPATKRMSALLMGTGIVPNTSARAWPSLWHHFDPTYALDADLPFSSARVVEERLVVEDAKRSASEVLGLLVDWPGPDPAFPRCQHRPEDHVSSPCGSG
ncbi:MAG: hypothetical protein ACYDHN_06805 [Solirubrobacteraceae bacterium]